MRKRKEMIIQRKQKRRIFDYAPVIIDALDRISQLPEPIMHHILFFMPAKDAARTSFLSKTWHRTWISLPTYDFRFHEKSFKQGGDFLNSVYDDDIDGLSSYFGSDDDEPDDLSFEEREAFFNTVDKALVVLKLQKVIVREFKLNMTIGDAKDASFTDDWIQLAIRNRIKKLDLCIKKYTLPEVIFVAESLTVLKLKGCKWPESPSIEENPEFAFSRLRELSIVKVSDIDWEIINYLLSGCPLLEEFTLKRCGLHFLQVVHNRKLKKAIIGQVNNIRIEAPTLKTLYCKGHASKHGGDLDLNASSCNNVKELKIGRFTLPKKFFEELNSKFPLLETLDTHLSCPGPIEISSHRLKRLVLSYCYDEPPIIFKINCKNLRHFKVRYQGFSKLPIPILVNSSSLQEIQHDLILLNHLSEQCFLQLRRYLGIFQQQQVLDLSISPLFDYKSAEVIEEDIPPISNIKHLHLRDTPSVQNYTALIDGLLWSCHPKILSLSASSLFERDNNRFVMVLCETLLGREEKPKCCSGCNTKCWRHYLKAVKVIYYYNGDKIVRAPHKGALSDLFLTAEEFWGIKFKLEW